MPRKQTPKQPEPEQEKHNELIDRIRKLSSVSIVLDLFDIEHSSTIGSKSFKVIFTDCKQCKHLQRRSVTYFEWEDSWECTNNKKCGTKVYPKHLLGLIKMATDSQGKELTPQSIARRINNHLDTIESERAEQKKQFERRNKQFGIYPINVGAAQCQ